MFFTPNFSLFYFYWFFQLYFFLCFIFNISLRPKHMCPGSCSLRAPLGSSLLSKGRNPQNKGDMNIHGSHTPLIHFSSTQTMGSPSQMISSPFSGPVETYPEFILWDTHLPNSVCIIRPKGLTRSSSMQRVGQTGHEVYDDHRVCVKPLLVQNRATRRNRRCNGQESDVSVSSHRCI